MFLALFAIALLVVLVLYRRLLGRVTAFVPARTHLWGWRNLDVADGSDTWVFVAFVIGFCMLLSLDWPLAFVWWIAVTGVMEILRRMHNNEPAGS